MTSFLSQVVFEVLQQHSNFLHLTFVVPSQRARVFLREEIIKHNTKTTFLPSIVSIEEFIQELAKIEIVDTTHLLFEFYDVYKNVLSKENVEPFDSFLQWATIALQDFNEIDSHLVNNKALFSTLYDIKRLKIWFKDQPLSSMAMNHLKFFEHLHLLYKKLNEKLLQQKVGYQGFVYKNAIKNLPSFIKTNNKHIVFVGFNALNASEESIFKELLLHKKASVYWDAPKSILAAENEAGFFLRKYKNTWNYYQKHPFLFVDGKEKEQQQNINIIGVAKNVGQIKYIGELLSKQSEFKKMAWVLADENILPIALQSIPKNVESINITMGYLLRDVPLSFLFKAFFKMHFYQQNEASKTFYYKSVLDLLQHPYMYKIDNKCLEVASKIKRENRLFVSYEYLKKTELKWTSLFSDFKNPNEIINQLLAVLNALKEKTQGLEKEFVYRFIAVFNQLQTLNKKYQHIKNGKTLALLYEQLLQSEKLSFRGEPLEGMQLMGMLETRALDFSTVIISSVNEGILPTGKTENSFIPYDVKRHFKLPTYQEKDAIFSYHFQRLLHRAKNIYLLYNTETDGYGSGEKSRFLTQLLIKNPALTSTTINTFVEEKKEAPFSVEKTPEMLTRLQEIFEKEGISPSALSNYIYNPITFYEQRVLRIKPDVEVEETIAANTMGTVIHGVLEDLYKPFIGKYVQVKDLKQMIKKVFLLQEKHFQKEFLNRTTEIGKNKLIFEVTHHYIVNFLKKEIALLQQGNQLQILATEQKIESTIAVEGVKFPVRIQGTIDRIDKLNNTIRIIDYKTGSVKTTDLKVPDFDTLIENEKVKALQVMLYTFLYLSNNNIDFNDVESGIISFKSLSSGMLKMNFSASRTPDNQITKQRVLEFIKQVKILIKEILNPKIPFEENPNNPFAS